VNRRCYLLDENIAPALAGQLYRLEPKIIVCKIGDETAPPKGTPDPEILCWLEREGFSLITQNRKSMPIHLKEHLASGRHVPGIFTLKPKASIMEAIQDLVLIWEIAESDEYQDQIVYIPL